MRRVVRVRSTKASPQIAAIRNATNAARRAINEAIRQVNLATNAAGQISHPAGLYTVQQLDRAHDFLDDAERVVSNVNTRQLADL